MALEHDSLLVGGKGRLPHAAFAGERVSATNAMTSTITAKSRPGWIGWAILVLALAGVVLSSFSLHAHYQKSATNYCDFDETFNCDIVNRSIFSEVYGVPVAGVGVAGYLALMIFAVTARRRCTALLMLVAALIGFAFALNLTYIEAYVLVVWCIMCIGSQAVITLILALSLWQTIRLWRV